MDALLPVTLMVVGGRAVRAGDCFQGEQRFVVRERGRGGFVVRWPGGRVETVSGETLQRLVRNARALEER
jgi:hypothetical protein